MEINRWWYSKEQGKAIRRLEPFHVCHVLINDKWYEYTEWTTSQDGKCNWEDAVLLVESEVKLPLMIDGVEQTIKEGF